MTSHVPDSVSLGLYRRCIQRRETRRGQNITQTKKSLRMRNACLVVSAGRGALERAAEVMPVRFTLFQPAIEGIMGGRGG